MSILYFDCETLSTGDDGMPVDIVLAVTRVDGVPTVWRERPRAAPFTATTAAALATCLVDHPGPVCTFNGASFDFKVVAALLPAGTLRQRLVSKCLHGHLDVMMDWFSSQGYYSSMAAFCAGCQLGGKSWSGAESAAAVKAALAPGVPDVTLETVMARVEEYCIDDTRCLEELMAYLKANCCLRRAAKTSGRIASWTPWHVRTIRTVAECIRHWQVMPVVPTWIESPPPPPHQMVAWVKAAVAS